MISLVLIGSSKCYLSNQFVGDRQFCTSGNIKEDSNDEFCIISSSILKIYIDNVKLDESSLIDSYQL